MRHGDHVEAQVERVKHNLRKWAQEEVTPISEYLQ